VRGEFARQLQGAYVLIGGDINDYDRALTPFSAFHPDTLASGAFDPRPPGIEIHATTIAQMLDGARLRQVSPFVLWAYAVLVVLCAGLTALLEFRTWRVVPLLLAQVAVFLGLPFFLMWRGSDTYGFPSVGAVLAWLLAFLAVTSAVRAAGAVQRRFAQGALGKYLPASIAQEIIDNPELLQLGGTKAEIFVMFSDLEGFTKMSHAISPEMVAKLLNRYLDLLSEVVLDHGGILDKFVGDAVVAFWGAPIARPDDGERAAKCGYAIWQAGEAFRAEVAAMDPNLPKIGKTRVGLHWGEAVVGNFGGENRIQYTALGDSMNTAARLESANKSLQSSVMASREFVERSGLDWWRPMGRVVLRGRAQPVDIFEPAPDFSKSDREALTKAMDMLASNRDEALVLIGDVVRRNPADKALQNLLSRIGQLDGENAYVLD
jgi:adenylate cyclase